MPDESRYDSSVGAVLIIQSTTGKKKDIFLTPDEAAFFDKHTHGKKQDELMFLRNYEGKGEKKGEREPWGKSHHSSCAVPPARLPNNLRKAREAH